MKPLLLVVVFLPNWLKIWVYNRFFNADISRSAKIGLSYLHANRIVIGPNGRIGHFNIIKNLHLLDMGEGAKIGHFNEIMAMPLGSKQHFSQEEHRLPALKMGRFASMVKGNFLDCNNTITLGDFTQVAGIGSTFFTHGIDVMENKQKSAPITVGRYCLICTRSVLVKGACLPDYSVLAANSALHKPYADTHTLYSGVPAVPIRQLPEDAGFFHRQVGFVP